MSGVHTRRGRVTEVVRALGKRVRGYGTEALWCIEVGLRLMHLRACGEEGALVGGGRGPWREREREREREALESGRCS